MGDGADAEARNNREIEPDTGRAPTCQTCHMPGGNHDVITAWGFLALRIPEEDGKWWTDRLTILQAVGVLDEKGNPTERFNAIKEVKFARMTKDDFVKERKKMIQVCSRCHARKFSEEQLEAGDDVIRDTDKVFAEAIRSVKSLYDDGILQKPAGWQYTPDLLRFYDAKTSMEQNLYLIFMEYRQRAFQGAFHANPDYMQWYGSAKVKEMASRIKEEAARVRKEARR